MLPGAEITIPRRISDFSTPRSRRPTLSPASPRSKILRNISTPVQVDFIFSSLKPMMSTSLPVLITPRSIRPVATVPRPVIVNTSSTDIRNGFSTSRGGIGIQLSTAAISSRTVSTHFGSPFNAPSAEPRITGVLSPSYS